MFLRPVIDKLRHVEGGIESRQWHNLVTRLERTGVVALASDGDLFLADVRHIGRPGNGVVDALDKRPAAALHGDGRLLRGAVVGVADCGERDTGDGGGRYLERRRPRACVVALAGDGDGLGAGALEVSRPLDIVVRALDQRRSRGRNGDGRLLRGAVVGVAILRQCDCSKRNTVPGNRKCRNGAPVCRFDTNPMYAIHKCGDVIMVKCDSCRIFVYPIIRTFERFAINKHSFKIIA